MHHIIINGIRLVRINKSGKFCKLVLEDNSVIFKTDIKSIYTECPSCLKLKKIKQLHHYNLIKATKCGKCKLQNRVWKKMSEETKKKLSLVKKGKYIGKKNPFYGKKHSQETKEKIRKNLLGKYTGPLNPFYGKTHSKKTIEQIVSKRKQTVKNFTLDKKLSISKKLSEAQVKLQKQNIKLYRESKSRGGIAAAKSKNRYKINKIEKIIQNELLKRNMKFQYSVILNRYQFDFGNKEKRILIEVQGDYWHGNPNKYSQFNLTQKNIKLKDIKKNEFALLHNFQIFYIWEEDILQSKFTVLDKIQELYEKI